MRGAVPGIENASAADDAEERPTAEARLPVYARGLHRIHRGTMGAISHPEHVAMAEYGAGHEAGADCLRTWLLRMTLTELVEAAKIRVSLLGSGDTNFYYGLYTFTLLHY